MKIFTPEQRSLFGDILDWMLTPLLLLWPVSLFFTWAVAQNLANKPFDRSLEYNARALAQLVTVRNGKPQLNLPQSARELLRADDSDQIYYQLRGFEDEYITGERDLPAFPLNGEKPNESQAYFGDAIVRGLPVRVAAVWLQPNEGQAFGYWVQVAETKEKRSVLAGEIIKGVMLPQFVILPLAVLLVWLALVRGLKPLSRLERKIRKRKPDDLSPLDISMVPLEVAPLVKSINDLLDRLESSINTQKRFLADAAHQLKTPLAGLRIQADMALRENATAQDLKISLQNIGRSSKLATHTVNQLLALARAEGGGRLMKVQKCNMAQLAIEVIHDLLGLALQKKIDLGYEGVDEQNESVITMGNPILLKELIRNLIDNALQYTPSSPERPGIVTVRVKPDNTKRQVVLQVEDTGPGIADEEKPKVMQAFYRTLGAGADGSGLGLAIVQEIVSKHGASIALEDARASATYPGVRWTLRFSQYVWANT